MKSFSYGGIHPPENKLSCNESIIVAKLPLKVYLPLSQHIGAPAKPVVEVGDRVLVGQLVAEASGFMSANIHASIAGEVKAIAPMPNGQGAEVMTIVIERQEDDEDVWVEDIDATDVLVKPYELEPSKVIDRIWGAGIVGMGGAAFPTHVKLTIPHGKRARILIINGVECEPYLTSDHLSMLQRSDELLVGVKILMDMLDLPKAHIGIEFNKRDAIEQLREMAKSYDGIKIVPLEVKYPQGGEKQLIEAITGREVPPAPALPIDVGVVVVNVSTALAVYDAVHKHKPLFERVVTVSGKSVSYPANLLVRMGTPISELIDFVGGLPSDTGKVVNGGPMMGRALTNLDAPVVKGCSGITIISESEALRPDMSPCLKCGKCVSVCPMLLEPYLLSKMMQRSLMDDLEMNNATDCIECGSCQFTCPAQLPLLDYIRLAKQRVMGIVRARAIAAQQAAEMNAIAEQQAQEQAQQEEQESELFEQEIAEPTIEFGEFAQQEESVEAATAAESESESESAGEVEIESDKKEE
ncbi:MAG: electron transport complex subunit RsxC [Rikenellaceae bacterium]